jgi:hypothetical protein
MRPYCGPSLFDEAPSICVAARASWLPSIHATTNAVPFFRQGHRRVGWLDHLDWPMLRPGHPYGKYCRGVAMGVVELRLWQARCAP